MLVVLTSMVKSIKLIGTDVSLATCREEGYLMMVYKNEDYDLVKNYSNNILVEFKKTFPELGFVDNFGKDIAFITCRTGRELWDMYVKNQKVISDFDSSEHQEPTNLDQLLSLADSIEAYFGFDWHTPSWALKFENV